VRRFAGGAEAGDGGVKPEEGVDGLDWEVRAEREDA
jgi:hypothetical protein